jgi:hypothetical protein
VLPHRSIGLCAKESRLKYAAAAMRTDRKPVSDSSARLLDWLLQSSEIHVSTVGMHTEEKSDAIV